MSTHTTTGCASSRRRGWRSLLAVGLGALAGSTIQVEPLETLTEVEQTKKIANLPNLRPESVTTTAAGIRDRAIAATSGNPRLLDWLDKIVADTCLDVEGLIAAIENEADRFRRENIFAEKLLGAQPVGLQKMLATVNVVELPCPPRRSTPSTTTPTRLATSAGPPSSVCSKKAPIPTPAICATSSPTSCVP
ncbi:MAG: hypothetical protein ACR2G2_17165 [Pseudonocardia sp.]